MKTMDMADPKKYTVGWICALPLESVAAQALLDEEHDDVPTVAQHDNNSYALGRIGQHNIVIAVLPHDEYGLSSATAVARDLLHSFPNVRIGLMVGIGGGAPSSKHDVRLGDVVVSSRAGGKGGVFQYDYGKAVQNKDVSYEHTDFLDQPPMALRTAVAGLKSKHKRKGHQLNASIEEALRKWPRLRSEYSRPPLDSDRLYSSDVVHPDSSDECAAVCSSDPKHLVVRPERGGHQDNPAIHYGLIASANQLMKDVRIRDQLASERGVLCFEMEAAGLMNHFPCLVIRGICDYADSHKNKEWQGYAAMVATAYAKELLQQIPASKVEAEKPITQLVSELQQTMSNTNNAIRQQTHKEEVRYLNDKQIECHRAFKTSDYEKFKTINLDRVPGTCKWVLDHHQYTQWRQSQHDDLLWISADPGCGKSVLAKSLIDNDLPSASDHTVCYFFFKDNEEQNGLATALCAVLHQLFGSKPTLLRHAACAYEKNGEKLQNEVDELWRIFLAAATDELAGAVSCIFDALDECQSDGRKKIIRLLSNFYARHGSTRATKSRLKFLVTSRPYRDIESGFGEIPSDLPSVRLAGEESNADISEEINLVIRQRIQTAGDRLHPDQDVRDALEERLLATPHRTYLWLHLVWSELENSIKRTRKAFLKKIDSLPVTVGEAYESILKRHSRGQRKEAETLLHIVVGARRPLTLEEMDVAFQLATDSPDAQRHEDLDLDGDCLKSHIRELCGLFVFISDNRVYLIHQTAKEFLVAKTAEGSSDGWKHSLAERDSNQVMTRVCVQYLLFNDIADDRHWESAVKDDAAADFPFLNYSSTNWPAHYREMVQSDESLFNHMFGLYDAQTRRFQTWVSIFWRTAYPSMRRSSLKPAHLAALNGHIGVLEKMMQTDQIEINEKDGTGRTPLLWAAEEGHVEVVSFLLANGADVNAQGGDYGNALQAASVRGHGEIVKTLLANEADINAQGGFYDNALQAASERGHDKIRKLLLAAGADVNAQGGWFGNALQTASYEGRGDIVELLLTKRAEVNAQGGWYGNALQAASADGHDEIVKLLLASGANVNAQGGHFGNALYAASAGCHEEIVDLLLENGADINAQGGYYGNALQTASYEGRDDIVELLLTKGADVNAQGSEYGHALQAASAEGHDEIVKLLLAEGAEVNAQGGEGGNALYAASAGGHGEIVELLLANGANVNAQGGYYGNAMQAASARGHVDITRILQQHTARLSSRKRLASTPPPDSPSKCQQKRSISSSSS